MRACLIILSLLVAGCSVDRTGYAYAIPPVADAQTVEAAVTDATLLLDRTSNDAAAPPDTGKEPDAGEPDAVESGIPDVRAADATPDASVDAEPVDTGPEDAGVPDAAVEADATTPDAAEADAESDTGARDASVPDTFMPDAFDPPDAGPEEDAGIEDGGPDAAVSDVPCTDGTVEQAYPGRTDIAGCDGALNQCEAHLLCAVGWHLCTYGEYVGRGGDMVSASAVRWLASCIRGETAACEVLSAPSDMICGACARSGTSSVMLGSRCDGTGPVTDTDCPLGVVAFGTGPRVELGAASCARVNVSAASAAAGASCCR